MFRYITDFGIVGPDKGKGGQVPVRPQDVQGRAARGLFTVRTPAIETGVLPAFVKDGDIAGAIKSVKAGFRLYPLSKAANPPAQKFFNVSGKKYNTIHANDYNYFEELNRVVQNEPEDTFEPQLTGSSRPSASRRGSRSIPTPG